jgi:replicative DNA helicase
MLDKVNLGELLALYVFDREFHFAVDDLMTEEFFDHPLYRQVFSVAREFYQSYGDVPSQEAFNAFVVQKYPQTTVQELELFWRSHRRESSPATKRFYLDHLQELRRIRIAQEVIRKGIEQVSQGKVDDFVHEVVSSLSFQEKDIRTVFFRRDLERMIQSLSNVEEERTLTLFPTLDSYLGGGFARRELIIILGGTGVGKTAFLVNLAWSAILQEKKVFYYTFEVSAERIVMRLLSLILSQNYQEILIDPQKAIQKLDEHVMSALFNNFIVVEAPTFSMTTAQLDSNIEKLVMQGQIPDIVFVDYADIMLSQRSYRERWLELETSYMELRSIAMKRNLVMVTASQITREGADAKQIRLEHVKGSYGKTHNADVVLSLNRTPEDKYKDNQIRLYINKNRNNIADQDVILKVDYETMTFMEAGSKGNVSSSNFLV